MPLLEEHRQDLRPFAEELARLHGPAVQLHDALAEGSRGRNGADERLLGRDEFDAEGEYYFCLVTSIDATPSEVARLFQKRGDHVLLFSTLATKVVEIGDNGLFG